MIARYRALWSVSPGTTDPLAPFGVVTLAAGGSEGSPQNMAAIRSAQTGGYNVLPNPAMPATFLAQVFAVAMHMFRPCDAPNPTPV